MKITPITGVTSFTLELSPQEMDTITMALGTSSKLLEDRIHEDRMLNSCMINGEQVPYIPPNNEDEFNLRATNTLLKAIDKVRSGLNETK